MSKYLKVGDAFSGGIGFSVRHSDEQVRVGTHAINTHDDLVAMNQELLAALEALDDCYSDTSRNYLTRSELQHHKAVRSDVADIIAKCKGGAS